MRKNAVQTIVSAIIENSVESVKKLTLAIILLVKFNVCYKNIKTKKTEKFLSDQL